MTTTWTNGSKPTSTVNETWTSITTTWATETRTWAETAGSNLYTNQTKPS
jgi:hypothetical protein